MRAQREDFEQEKLSLQAQLRKAQAEIAAQQQERQALAREVREARMAAAAAAAEAEAQAEARLQQQAAAAQRESHGLRAALRKAQAEIAEAREKLRLEEAARQQAVPPVQPRVNKTVRRLAPLEPRQGSGAPAAAQEPIEPLLARCANRAGQGARVCKQC